MDEQNKSVNEEKADEKLKSSDSKTKLKSYQYVPYGVLSFDEYDAYSESEKTVDYLHSVMSVYTQIVENILYNGVSVNPLLDIQNATLELFRRLQMNKSLSSVKEFNHKNDTVAIVKSANSFMEWYGVPTNKFEDKEADIFMNKSHKRFVEKLKNGEAPMPALYIWHITEPVGVATNITYDERGYLKAQGIIYPQYEELVVNLAKSEPNMGMSHGNKLNVIKFNDENPHWIEEYASHELTFLPNQEAANELTDFGLGDRINE